MAWDEVTSHHIVRSWHEWEIDGRERRIVLVVETELELQPEKIDYDHDLVEELRAAAIARLRATASAIDRIRIVPVRYRRNADG